MRVALWASALAVRTSRIAVLLLLYFIDPALSSGPLGQSVHSEHGVKSPGGVIAVVPNYWPPHYDYDASGKPIGFAIDVFEEIAERAGLDVTYKIAKSFPEAIDILRRGDAHLIPNFGITPERLDDFAFSAPVETFALYVFVRKDTITLNDVSSLVGKRLAVVKGNIGAPMFEKRKDIDVQVYPDVRAALFQLLAGHVDALAFPRPVILNIASAMGVQDRIKTIGRPLREIRRGIGVRKTDTALLAILNPAVKDFVRTPAYQRIYAKWYGRPQPYWTPARILWTMGVVFVLVFLVMAGWRYRIILRLNRMLEKEVAERTLAERSLAQSELRATKIMENASDGIITIDEAGLIETFNPAAEKIFGYRAHEVIGKNVSVLMPSPEATEHDTYLRRYLETGQHKVLGLGPRELRGRRKDGTIFPVEIGIDEMYLGDRRLFIGDVRDITERKLAEDALRDSEERLRAVFENTPISLNLKDAEGRYLLINKPCERWLGHPAEEIIGKKAGEFLENPTEQEIMAAAENIVLETGKPCMREVSISRPDGEVYERILIKFPVKSGNDTVSAIGTVALDITERKRIEAELRRSDERFHDITSNVPGIVYQFKIDADGRRSFPFVSNSIKEILGLEPSEVIREANTWFDIIHPDDRSGLEESIAESHRTLNPWLWEGRIIHPGGSVRWFRGSSTPRKLDDGSVLWNGLVLDITDRKETEEALRASQAQLFLAQEMAHIGSWDLDLINDSLSWSDEIYRMFEVSPDTFEPNYEAFLRLVHPDDREAVDKAYSKSLAHREPYQIEHRVLMPDGRIKFVEERCHTWYDDDGKPTRSVGTVQDITERREAEKQLQQAQKMEAVGQLTGGVAHDFNNLLAVSIGNVELAEEAAQINGDVQPHLANIKRACERGASLTNQLLAFSRKQTLFPQEVDAGELVGSMTDLLRRSLGETIEVKVISEAGLWSCEVDPALLESAILNLAINARDAMPRGGRLTINTANFSLTDDYTAAQMELEPGMYVVIAVTDTGTGMAADVIGHVFDPFFTTKDVGEGSGLGLSMVYGFVKQSGGHVTIYSEEESGTTIKLYLPRSKKTYQHTRQIVAVDAPTAQGETVLVVEDDPDLRILSVALLKSFGYEVLDAADGDSALKALEFSPDVDLLFTDVVLPGGMSGPELAAEVRRRYPRMSVLYASGYTDLANSGRSSCEPDAELLQKPYQKADLAQKVRAAMDASKQ